MGYDDVVDAELFHISNRGKFQRLIFKAAANDNYPSPAVPTFVTRTSRP